ncbi:Flp family type IVb pilin [Erythrobacter litoralis]|uniref:Flp family type IVb pilin n=1 Tax=Erythrobacter litoralis TaxID=39960 RepID=UPI0024351F14|nr:Flp family type IVb pilin [Erythrobacter litoralis]MDG6079802.1 Flp family type IVb pilin [Erythrobacter litoralis]
MIRFFKHLKDDDRGATAVEYGLILALIFFAMVGALTGFGQSAIDMWSGIDESVGEAMAEK